MLKKHVIPRNFKYESFEHFDLHLDEKNVREREMEGRESEAAVQPRNVTAHFSPA